MSRAPEVQARTEVRDGMRITWHQPIPMDDGIVLRADVFRPTEDGHYPMQREKMVRGKDYEYEGELWDPGHRRHDAYAGGGRQSYLLPPIIPSKGGTSRLKAQ